MAISTASGVCLTLGIVTWNGVVVPGASVPTAVSALPMFHSSFHRHLLVWCHLSVSEKMEGRASNRHVEETIQIFSRFPIRTLSKSPLAVYFTVSKVTEYTRLST